jgi:hypothetical protein
MRWVHRKRNLVVVECHSSNRRPTLR